MRTNKKVLYLAKKKKKGYYFFNSLKVQQLSFTKRWNLLQKNKMGALAKFKPTPHIGKSSAWAFWFWASIEFHATLLL